MKASPTTVCRLKLSTSRKVAPKADRHKGALVKNCFSLPAGRDFSCPGATADCDPHRGGYCYAGRDELRFPSVRRLVEHNLEQLKACHGSIPKMVDLLDEVVTAFETYIDTTDYAKVFRIHEDGDFFSVSYAKAWRIVIERHPGIQFWAYTRSYTTRVNVVPWLAGIDNLGLYVSVDAKNFKLAESRKDEWAALGVKTAFAQRVTEEVGPQEMAVELLGRRAPICPEVAGKVPLVNEEGVGACITCGLCITQKQPIIFPIHR